MGGDKRPCSRSWHRKHHIQYVITHTGQGKTLQLNLANIIFKLIMIIVLVKF